MGLGQTQQQAAEDAVPDNEIRGRPTRDGMLGGSRQRQQNALVAQPGRQGDSARLRRNQGPRRATEQAARIDEIAGAGNEDLVTDPRLGQCPGIDHPADRLVSGNKGITQARKRRHPPGPQKPLGPGADSTPVDLDDHIVGPGRLEIEPTKRQTLRLLQHDSKGVHSATPFAGDRTPDPNPTVSLD